MIEQDEFDTVEPAPRRPHGPRVWPIAAAIGVVIALVLVYFLWFRERQPPPPPPATVADRAPAVESTELPTPEEEFELPPLDASDAVVRELAAGLSAHPRLAAWLVSDDLVRRFTVAVTNLSEGVTPRSHLSFLRPGGSLEAMRWGEALVVDPASYERFETVVGVFESLDTPGLAQLYQRFEPLMEQAHRELGYPEGDFRSTVLEAFRHLLATPRVEQAKLTPTVTGYEFADPALESLSGAQKQLLRMGPRNVERVQAKITEIGLALGFSPEQLRG